MDKKRSLAHSQQSSMLSDSYSTLFCTNSLKNVNIAWEKNALSHFKRNFLRFWVIFESFQWQFIFIFYIIQNLLNFFFFTNKTNFTDSWIFPNEKYFHLVESTILFPQLVFMPLFSLLVRNMLNSKLEWQNRSTQS